MSQTLTTTNAEPSPMPPDDIGIESVCSTQGSRSELLFAVDCGSNPHLLYREDGTDYELWKQKMSFVFEMSGVTLVFQPIDPNYALEGVAERSDGDEIDFEYDGDGLRLEIHDGSPGLSVAIDLWHTQPRSNSAQGRSPKDPQISVVDPKLVFVAEETCDKPTGGG